MLMSRKIHSTSVKIVVDWLISSDVWYPKEFMVEAQLPIRIGQGVWTSWLRLYLLSLDVALQILILVGGKVWLPVMQGMIQFDQNDQVQGPM